MFAQVAQQLIFAQVVVVQHDAALQQRLDGRVADHVFHCGRKKIEAFLDGKNNPMPHTHEAADHKQVQGQTALRVAQKKHSVLSAGRSGKIPPQAVGNGPGLCKGHARFLFGGGALQPAP